MSKEDHIAISDNFFIGEDKQLKFTIVDAADAAIDVAVADLANGSDGLTALKSAVDAIPTTTPPTVGAIANQVWDEAQADHVGAGTFGGTASEIAAVKTTTDKLTFTKANEVDSNVQSINDVTITGDGSDTPFNV